MQDIVLPGRLGGGGAWAPQLPQSLVGCGVGPLNVQRTPAEIELLNLTISSGPTEITHSSSLSPKHEGRANGTTTKEKRYRPCAHVCTYTHTHARTHAGTHVRRHARADAY